MRTRVAAGNHGAAAVVLKGAELVLTTFVRGARRPRPRHVESVALRRKTNGGVRQGLAAKRHHARYGCHFVRTSAATSRDRQQ